MLDYIYNGCGGASWQYAATNAQANPVRVRGHVCKYVRFTEAVPGVVAVLHPELIR